MANKPIKIKRNTSISGKKRQRMAVVKKVASILLTIAGLAALGFLGAPAVMEMIDNLNNPKPPVSEPAVTPAPDPTQQPEATDDPSDVQTENIPVKTAVFSSVTANDVRDAATITATAQRLKNMGVTDAVVTFKDAEGRIYFETATEIGRQAKGPVMINVEDVVRIFGQEDISVTAQVYAFMDKITPAVDRETAVKFQGTDMNWLDSSKELGGKPWANPASATMQNYIYDIVKELGDRGVKDFIISGVQLPTGYSLEYRDFGVTNDQLQAQLQGFINTIQSKVAAKGGNAYLAYDLAPLISGDVSRYMISPLRYGASHVVLVGTNADFENGAADGIIGKYASDEAVEMLCVWNTEQSLAEGENINGYFVK
ncbi:MAG: hypothetical protein IJO54_05250 [Oscillospiraceae bacterium]|nr:hypothetical protein [Oscillospiraceae bacterium]